MTLANLARACTNWDGDRDAFHAIVAESVGLFGNVVLAEAFGVAPSTVLRWADGSANPHPYVRKQIVDYIELYARRQLDYSYVNYEAVLSENNRGDDRIFVVWAEGSFHVYHQYKKDGAWKTWQDSGICLDEEETLRLRILLNDWFR